MKQDTIEVEMWTYPAGHKTMLPAELRVYLCSQCLDPVVADRQAVDLWVKRRVRALAGWDHASIPGHARPLCHVCVQKGKP